MTPEQHAVVLLKTLADDYGQIPKDEIAYPIIADAIRAAVAEEREACAKIADAMIRTVPYTEPNYDMECGQAEGGRMIAECIRKRGQP